MDKYNNMSFDDFPLYYEIKGTKGPYILMLHGILSSRVQWQANIDAISVFGQPVVVELFGHGRSPTPDNAAFYKPEAYCSEFERIRKEIGADKWFVVGNSLGGALTLRYSLTYPERVIAQAFTNSSSALADQNMSKKMQWLADKVGKDGIRAFKTLPLNPANSKMLPPDIKTALLEDLKLITDRGLAYTVLYTAMNSSVREIISENKVPTLLVAGIRETRFLTLRDYAEQHMPFLKIVNLDGGHGVNITAAESFNQALLEFFLTNFQQD